MSYLIDFPIGAQKKSQELDNNFKKATKLNNCYYFNPGEIITTSIIDSIHYDKVKLLKIKRKLTEKAVDW